MTRSDREPLIRQLQQGVKALDIELSESQIQRCVDYVLLLLKWNQVYNLTAITDPSRMLAYHILDSLVVQSAISEEAFSLDVGTGAGLPGIPLAIVLPRSNWTLIDSNGKKTRFVQQAVAELGLTNVKVVQTRVQDYDAASPLDVIVSRAYASLADFVESVQHLWQPGTRLITMKTELSDAEISSLDRSGYQLQITPIQVPGIHEPRSLVSIDRRNHD